MEWIPFRIVSLVLFLGLLAFYIRKALRREKPSVVCSGAILLPLLLCSLAALMHLTDVQDILDGDESDIVNPSAGIQIVSEFLWVGVVMSSILCISLVISVLSAKRVQVSEQSTNDNSGCDYLQ
jgi:hypothetical protein